LIIKSLEEVRILATIEDYLSEIGKQRTIKRNNTPQSPCLADEEIAQFTDGLCNEKERNRAMGHINQCTYCSHAVAELVKLMESINVDIVEVPEHILKKEKGVLPQLSSPPKSLISIIQDDFRIFSRSLTDSFIRIYHEAEQETIEVFWDLLAPMVEPGMELQRSNVEMGALGIVGKSPKDTERVTPSTILTVLSVFNIVQEWEGIEEDKLRRLIREKADLFELPDEAAKELEDYILEKLKAV
jgi:hypothetical protein